MQNQVTQEHNTVHSYRNGRDEVQNLKKATEMEDVQHIVVPEEVAEKIMARLPFPSIFKTMLLSKSWKDRISISCQVKKSLLTPLQKEVISVSTNWTSYSPVFFSKDAMLGFDRLSMEWKCMFDLSYFPIAVWSEYVDSVPAPSILGSLVLVISRPLRGFRYGGIFITNVITRSWRELHLPPLINSTGWYPAPIASLIQGDFDTYKVLVLCTSLQHYDLLQTAIYDSSVRKWSVTISKCEDLTARGIFLFTTVYHQEKFYCICKGARSIDSWKLCIHNVESDKTWRVIPLSIPTAKIIGGGILLCGQRIMVLIWRKKRVGVKDRRRIETIVRNADVADALPVSVQVYQLDLDSLQPMKVGKGQLIVLLRARDCFTDEKIRIAADDDFIYLCSSWSKSGTPMVTFNIHNHEWGCLPLSSSSWMDEHRNVMLGCAFAPGLNPFVTV